MQDSAVGPSDGPLAGLDVVDLTQMLAGPYATMLLADLGANVVKVESPTGDMTRSKPPNLTDDEDYGGYFGSINRNKRSVVLDLKTEEGREALRYLAADADVLIENFRVGTMERLDLSYEELRETNPELVYASIRGFGDPRTLESPYAERPAFDLIAQAMGGLMSITGTEETGPVKAGPGVGDIFPAVLAVVGILAAIHHRVRTGEGQYVDVSMVDGILSMTERIVYQYAIGNEIPGPLGNTHPLLFPFDRFETSDGYVVIAAPSVKHWTTLCEHMDRPDLAATYTTEEALREHADELREIINDWTRRHTKDQLSDRLGADVPCAPVKTVADIFDDPHFRTREMLTEVEHADTGEQVTVAGTPIKFTGTETGVTHRAPLLGEHTLEVLREVDVPEDTRRRILEALDADPTDD